MISNKSAECWKRLLAVMIASITLASCSPYAIVPLRISPVHLLAEKPIAFHVSIKNQSMHFFQDQTQVLLDMEASLKDVVVRTLGEQVTFVAEPNPSQEIWQLSLTITRIDSDLSKPNLLCSTSTPAPYTMYLTYVMQDPTGRTTYTQSFTVGRNIAGVSPVSDVTPLGIYCPVLFDSNPTLPMRYVQAIVQQAKKTEYELVNDCSVPCVSSSLFNGKWEKTIAKNYSRLAAYAFLSPFHAMIVVDMMVMMGRAPHTKNLVRLLKEDKTDSAIASLEARTELTPADYFNLSQLYDVKGDFIRKHANLQTADAMEQKAHDRSWMVRLGLIEIKQEVTFRSAVESAFQQTQSNAGGYHDSISR